MKIINILVILFFPIVVFTVDLLTIKCSPPVGHRYDIEKNKVEEKKDGMKTVHPVFLLDKKQKKELLVKFPSADWFKKELKKNNLSDARDKFEKALLVHNTKDMISAVQVLANEVWQYTFYPEKKIAFFARQGIFMGMPLSMQLYSKCEFSE